MVSRRGFLKALLGGATAVATTPVILELVPKIKTLEATTGFGLAPIKAEGSVVSFDVCAREGIITTGVSPAALWPGVSLWFKEAYELSYKEFYDDLYRDNNNA